MMVFILFVIKLVLYASFGLMTASVIKIGIAVALAGLVFGIDEMASVQASCIMSQESMHGPGH